MELENLSNINHKTKVADCRYPNTKLTTEDIFQPTGTNPPSHIQTISYPDYLISRPSHIQTISYPDYLVSRLSRIQTISYPDYLVSRLSRIQTISNPDYLVSRRSQSLLTNLVPRHHSPHISLTPLDSSVTSDTSHILY